MAIHQGVYFKYGLPLNMLVLWVTSGNHKHVQVTHQGM